MNPRRDFTAIGIGLGIVVLGSVSLSQVVSRWRRVPFAASLREFVISRGRRTRWPSVAEIERMDEAQFETYLHAIGLDKKIAKAKANRQGGAQPKVERVLGQGDSIGAIEGQLETVSVHGRQYFTIYDAVTGRGVRSYFPDSMLARAVAALGKSVIVHGRLRRDIYGVPREMRDVDNLHTLGNLGVSPESLAGAYRGLNVREYLAEIRGE